MATSYNNVQVSSGPEWIDLTALQPGIVSAPGTFIQNIGTGVIYLFFGGASAPALGNGIYLNPSQGYYDKAGTAKIWARGGSTLALVKD